MTLDFSVGAFINAAGGAFFLGLGVFTLAIAGLTARGRKLGWACTIWGAMKIVTNLWTGSEVGPEAADTLGYVAVTCASVLVAVDVARALTRARRRVLVASALAALAIVGAILATLAPDPIGISRALGATGTDAAVAMGIIDGLAQALAVIVFIVITAAAGLSFDLVRETKERRALALLALTFGPWAMLIVEPIAQPSTSAIPVTDWLAIAYSIVLVALPAGAWLFGTRASSDRGWARNVALALLATVFLAMATDVLPRAVGFDPSVFNGRGGVIRTLGALALAIAILRYDLLDVPLPRVALRSGPLAAATLALVFIVAQVAQNFFAAQYGLLLGGIIAGTFLFAAQPVQRMIERRGERRVGVEPASSQSELVFKAAIRAALAEGPLTRAQDAHLAEVAHHLGIGPRDMVRLTREAENERLDVRFREEPS